MGGGGVMVGAGRGLGGGGVDMYSSRPVCPFMSCVWFLVE